MKVSASHLFSEETLGKLCCQAGAQVINAEKHFPTLGAFHGLDWDQGGWLAQDGLPASLATPLHYETRDMTRAYDQSFPPLSDCPRSPAAEILPAVRRFAGLTICCRYPSCRGACVIYSLQQNISHIWNSQRFIRRDSGARP